MINDQIKQLTLQLRLTGISDGFLQRVEQAHGQSLNYQEFLKLILEDEVLQRRNKAAQRLTSKAKFRAQSSIEDWDQSFERGIPKIQLRELASLAFYYSQENLLLLGRTGEGKTHLAVALGRRLCAEGISTMFLPVNFLFEEILAAKAAGRYLSFIKKLTKTQAIILDDFGLRTYTHDEANYLIDILEDRHQKGSVIVTSQVEPRGWIKLFEDPVIAEAIVSRLEHPSQKISLKGGDYREKLQRKLPKGKST